VVAGGWVVAGGCVVVVVGCVVEVVGCVVEVDVVLVEVVLVEVVLVEVVLVEVDEVVVELQSGGKVTVQRAMVPCPLPLSNGAMAMARTFTSFCGSTLGIGHGLDPEN
jgi:hypothetical protein